MIVYEMTVRAFTADESSGLSDDARGSYAGVAAKVEHSKSLGVNVVELLPVFEYDEMESSAHTESERSHGEHLGV